MVESSGSYHCPRCGNALTVGQATCAACGRPLAWDRQLAPPTAPGTFQIQPPAPPAAPGTLQTQPPGGDAAQGALSTPYVCPRCGADVLLGPGQRICPACWTALPDRPLPGPAPRPPAPPVAAPPYTCHYCAGPVAAADWRCPRCGERVRRVATDGTRLDERRGGCLSAFLAVNLVGDALVVGTILLAGLAGPPARELVARLPQVLALLIVASTLVEIACLLAIWHRQRWGVYGLVSLTVFGVVCDRLLGMSLWNDVLGVGQLLLLLALVHPIWPDME